MHGVHGLAGEPQCVHLATRVAGTGRGAAGAEEEEESSGRGPNGVMTNERGREVSSNTSVDAGAHCVTGRRIVIISSVISSAVYASTGTSTRRIMRLLLEATTIGASFRFPFVCDRIIASMQSAILLGRCVCPSVRAINAVSLSR